MDEASADLENRRRRAHYRAVHRGTKEMDWLLGQFASHALPHWDQAKLSELEALLQRPDPELYDAIMTGTGLGEPAHDDIIRQIRLHHGLTRP